MLKEWFVRTLLYSQAVTQTNNYADFATVARLAIEMTAKIHAVQWSEADTASILTSMKTCPLIPMFPARCTACTRTAFIW